MGSVDEADVEKAEEQERKEQWSENVSTAEQAASPEEEKQPVATPLADSSSAAHNGSGPGSGAAETEANVRAKILSYSQSSEQGSGTGVATQEQSTDMLDAPQN